MRSVQSSLVTVRPYCRQIDLNEPDIVPMASSLVTCAESSGG